VNSHAQSSANGQFLIIIFMLKTFRINVKYKELMNYISIEVFNI
jgi:hypothetical protein